MTENTDPNPRETSFGQDLKAFARHHLRGWRGMAAAGVLLTIPALWLGGPTFVAVGGLSLLISLAPCLVMCGLGLCVMKSCDKKAKIGEDTVSNADATASVAVAAATSNEAMNRADEPASR